MSATMLDKQNSKEMYDSLINSLNDFIGNQISISIEQLRGGPINAIVKEVVKNRLKLELVGDATAISQFSVEQEVITRFEFKNQQLSVNGRVYLQDDEYFLELGSVFIPTNRRRFTRYNRSFSVKCAALPQQNSNPTRVNRLRWEETDSLNISCGGIMIKLPTELNNESYLMLNIEATDLGFPSLMIGQVRYSIATDDIDYNIGIEFIPSEHKEKHFPSMKIKRLPREAFTFDVEKRKNIELILKDNFSRNPIGNDSGNTIER